VLELILLAISLVYGRPEQAKSSGAAQQQRAISFPVETFSPRSHLRAWLPGCTYTPQLCMARSPSQPSTWHCARPLPDRWYLCQIVKHPDMTCPTIHMWTPRYWDRKRLRNLLRSLDTRTLFLFQI